MSSLFDASGRLTLTQAQVYSLYNDVIADGLFDFPRDVTVNVTLDDLSRFGPFVFGSTRFKSDHEFVVRLDAAAAGLKTSGSKRSQDLVPENRVLCGITTLYHEFHHAQQYLACIGKFSYPEFSEDIAVSMVAANQNDVYYHSLHGQFLHELDAQVYSIRQTYAFLTGQCGDSVKSLEQVDRCVLDHVNRNLGIEYHFTPPRGQSQFRSIDEVLDALPESYSRWNEPLFSHKYSGREFISASDEDKLFTGKAGRALKGATSAVKNLFGKRVTSSGQQDGEWAYDEFAAAKVCSQGKSGRVFSAWHKMWDDFSYVDTMRDACRILCSFSAYLHPEYLERYVCLRDIQDELSVSSCFTRYTGSEFPESRAAIIDDIKDMCPVATSPRGLGNFDDDSHNAQQCQMVAFKPDRSVPEAAGIPPSCTPDYDSVERPAVRPQSCSGRSLCGLDVDPDNSNNVSNDFERS